MYILEPDKDPSTQSPSSEKKRETTMDFAANIEKVREVSHRVDTHENVRKLIENID